ncbi:hypothetical protein F5Y15DRAFT_107606 [Xylariaceae sp. FL0016]|nr:hypothetical protein F5Y15DRAFT_107606 [Xylariaceae sp. FL0016]
MGALFARRPQHEDVTKIPTPPLQAVGLFINFFLPALALVAVSLRAWTRIMLRQLGPDDYLLFLAMLCSMLMCGPFYMYIKLNYFGWHAKDVPEFDPAPGLWWFYLAQLFYNPVLALVKASILFFLLRLGGHKQNVRWIIYGLNTFNALQAVAIFLVALLQCLPIHANWDLAARASASCVDNSFHITISSITIVTDLLVLAIPFWIFLGLNMPMAARVAVIGAFLTGLTVTIIGVIRLVNIYKLFYVQSDPNADPYYSIGITLNVLEINLAIISAAIPTLRPLFRRWLPSLFGGSSDKYGSTAPKYGSNVYGRGTTRSGVHHQDNTNHLANNGAIALKSMHSRPSKAQHTEIRSVSPTDSEEEIMTYNGIMRTTDVRVQYDGDSISRSDGKVDSFTSRTSSETKIIGGAR